MNASTRTSPIGPNQGGVTCFTFNDCATVTPLPRICRVGTTRAPSPEVAASKRDARLLAAITKDDETEDRVGSRCMDALVSMVKFPRGRRRGAGAFHEKERIVEY